MSGGLRPRVWLISLMIVGCGSQVYLLTRHSGGSGKRFFIPMTGRGSSPIGTLPLRTGKPWRVKRGFDGQTENIAGGLFAMYHCAMKLESSSGGMEPLST